MRIVLVLGAGGSDGGQFIDGALTQLRTSTGFDAAHADLIIGTSVGAFRAGAVGRPVIGTAHVATTLRYLAEPPPTDRWPDRMAGQLRVAAGRLLARFVPRSRPAPTWDTPSGPYHPGARVVSVDLDRRHRVEHVLERAHDPPATIRASAAVPFAFGPVLLGDARHADGAVWSPTSADLASAVVTADGPPPVVVVIAPMVPVVGGSVVARLHRRQLRAELARLPTGAAVLVIGPGRGRRDETRTSAAGAAAVRRLDSVRGNGGRPSR